MEFVDRQITCMDCGQPFLFTAGEQEFYERKGFREEPKRCKPCRDARKVRKNGPGAMGSDPPAPRGGRAVADDLDDDIGNRAGPAPRGPREVREVRSARPASRGAPREMYDAVCAQCNTATKVPFKPVAGRPVYCRECYIGRRGAAP
jgi:CxxC-x17-CxxC domain-containing protein